MSVSAAQKGAAEGRCRISGYGGLESILKVLKLHTETWQRLGANENLRCSNFRVTVEKRYQGPEMLGVLHHWEGWILESSNGPQVAPPETER